MYIKKRQRLRKGIILVSFFFFPATFYYLSPVLILQASSQGIINGSWIVFLLLFLSALFLGRGFCGWLCPAAGCQEAIFLARERLVTKGNWFKWMIWFPWMAAIFVLSFQAGGYHSLDFFYQTVYGLSISNVEGSIVYFAVLFLLIVLPSFLVGKRSFCHHLCWMAPFMITSRKIALVLKIFSLRLQADAQQCIHCKVCTAHCPMSLPVEEMVEQGKLEHAECILCGTCIDVCKKEVIHYSMKL